jgi:asparagine synthase (glutamine-hydrolysing)
MCGICGFTGKPRPGVLKTMTDSLTHRGPDEDGYLTRGDINFGFRRLSILDVKMGRQPVHNEDSTLWSIFNGEIYNYIELREELEKRGHQLHTAHSDSELIVHLFEEYGYDFPNHINGMFAIALWDEPEKKLTLIRDRMGVKPLFYSLVNGELIFGSEIKAILNHPGYSRDVNLEAIYHYFSFKNIPAPLTAFKNIYSLLPGERIVFSKGQINKSRWWKVKFNEKENLDESKVEKNIVTLLEKSVQLRMRCDVPFGAYLSGGVDSSAIVALMSKFSDQPVKTFSLGYGDELKNKEADLHYARKVSKAYNTEHYEYIMSAQELVEDVENVIGAFDQPFSGTISTFFLSKLIKKHVKVALSGDGADELFGSYLSHRVARPMHHFKFLCAQGKKDNFTPGELDLFKPCDTKFLKDLLDRSGGEEKDWRYHLYLFTDEEKQNLLSPRFKSDLSYTTRALVEQNFNTLTAKGPLNRILEMEWNTVFPDQVLAFIDFLSMAHSVEVRSPFLDYELVNYAATLPDTLKIRNGNVKDILKRAVAPLLPEGIASRPKEGFVLPIFDWMVGNLKGYSHSVLSSSRLAKHDLLNEEEVGKILTAYRSSGNREYAGKLWSLMMFQIWWENYFG